MPFSTEQLEALSAELDKSNIKTRTQGGSTLSYIEAWRVINEANRIFGFDGWTRETTEMRMVSERERKIGRDNPRDGWSVSYVAKVRITVIDVEGAIIREGIGAGHGIDVDLGQAHESAVKEAESDAMKRALMTFGNQFGLSLYDKSAGTASQPQRYQQQPQRPAANGSRVAPRTMSNGREYAAQGFR